MQEWNSALWGPLAERARGAEPEAAFVESRCGRKGRGGEIGGRRRGFEPPAPVHLADYLTRITRPAASPRVVWSTYR